jgi:hypothetical protein
VTERLQHRRIENWYKLRPIPDDLVEYWNMMEMGKQWELVDTETKEVLWVGSKPNGFVSKNFPEALWPDERK